MAKKLDTAKRQQQENANKRFFEHEGQSFVRKSGEERFIYINSVLSNDEKIICTAELSKMAFLGRYVLVFLCVIGAFVVGTLINFYSIVALLLILSIAIPIMTTEMAFTNKRIIHKTGLIGRKVQEIRLDKIEGVTVDQGVYARIGEFGTIVVKGIGGSPSYFRNIANPIFFSKKINEYLDKI